MRRVSKIGQVANKDVFVTPHMYSIFRVTGSPGHRVTCLKSDRVTGSIDTDPVPTLVLNDTTHQTIVHGSKYLRE